MEDALRSPETRQLIISPMNIGAERSEISEREYHEDCRATMPAQERQRARYSQPIVMTRPRATRSRR